MCGKAVCTSIPFKIGGARANQKTQNNPCIHHYYWEKNWNTTANMPSIHTEHSGISQQNPQKWPKT